MIYFVNIKNLARKFGFSILILMFGGINIYRHTAVSFFWMIFLAIFSVVILLSGSKYFRLIKLAIKRRPALEVNKIFLFDCIKNVKYYWADIEEVIDDGYQLKIRFYRPDTYKKNSWFFIMRLFRNLNSIDNTCIDYKNKQFIEIINQYSFNPKSLVSTKEIKFYSTLMEHYFSFIKLMIGVILIDMVYNALYKGLQLTVWQQTVLSALMIFIALAIAIKYRDTFRLAWFEGPILLINNTFIKDYRSGEKYYYNEIEKIEKVGKALLLSFYRTNQVKKIDLNFVDRTSIDLLSEFDNYSLKAQ